MQQEQNPYKTTKLLLDGQQRLTSLLAVLRAAPIRVRSRQRPIELLFNLEHPEELVAVTEVDEDAEAEGDTEAPDASEDELLSRFNQMTFVVATKKLESRPNWVRVSDVFRTDERGLTYDEVTEIFVRVNSLGAKLRSSDLATAQITAKWQDSLKTFETFQDDCAAAGFDVGLGLHVRNLIAFTTGQSRFRTVGRLTVEDLRQGWEQAKQGMLFAVNFLTSNWGSRARPCCHPSSSSSL